MNYFLFFLLACSILSGAPIKPYALSRGDTIGIVSPGKPTDQKELGAIVANLKAKGFNVKVAANATTRNGYLAGEDIERAQEFMRIWLDPEVKAVWSFAGGYGSGRMLEHIDFKKIKKHPKIFVGMSDITAIHAALQKETGFVSFLGPNLNQAFDLGKGEKVLKYNQSWLWRSLSPKIPYNEGFSFQYPLGRHQDRKALVKGIAQGELVGGNLAMVVSLIGTKWEVNTQGKLLILEDVNEKPYKIDRMLWQLQASGALDQPTGVILASWMGCQSKHPSSSLSLMEIFDHYFGNRNYPVLYGFPSGHLDYQATLPLGVQAEVDTEKATLRLLESPIR